MNRYIVPICLFCWLTTLAPAASGCGAPSVLLPSDTLRSPAGLVGEKHCYRLDLPAPGLLHLAVSVAGWEPARTRWRLFGADTGTSPSGGTAAPETLGRWVGERLALVDAGTWYLEIAPEDPRLALPAYRLDARFVDLYALPTKAGENEGELEPDPETSTAVGVTAKGGENDGELEPDPETASSPGDDPAFPLRAALCDRNDTFACATAFSDRVAGELGGDRRDDGAADYDRGADADVFRFHLFAWRTVEVAIDGDADAYAALYDRAGQQLGESGEGADIRLVRTLGPGLYFVRVEDMGAPGAYVLTVRGLDD